MRVKRRQAVTLGQLRDRLHELLIEDDAPVMVVRNGIALGFYLPARVWRQRGESPLDRQMVELVLERAGQSREDIEACIDAGGRRKYMFGPA